MHLRTTYGLLQDLLRRFSERYPKVPVNRVEQLDALQGAEQEFVDLLDFTRALQAREPRYEAAYHYLVHRFVFQGSRAAMQAALNRRVQAVVAGSGALVLIEGVAGSGKTTLAEAQAIHAQELGAVFVVGHCHEQGTSPFWPWQEIVRSLEKLSAAPVDDLPSPLGRGAAARSIQHLARAFGEWLAKCAALRPLVVLLDDLHWADNDSLEILNQVAGIAVQQPLLAFATYRSEEVYLAPALNRYLPLLRRNPAVEILRLSPITPADTARFATAYLGACHPLLAAYLFQRAEGHLLFTVELLRDLVDQKLLTQDDDGLWHPPDQSLPVPRLLKNVILQRVARLGEQGQTVLAVAAVAGETWKLALVETMAALPEDDLLDTLERAIQADLIRIADERQELYTFSHGLIREVLYKQQISRRRKRLHERIGAYLETQTPLDVVQLAHHFYAADAWRQAFAYNYEAAREAAKNYANYRAIELYQLALESLHQVHEGVDANAAIEIYQGIGNAYRVLDLNQQAEISFNQMRDAALVLGDSRAEGIALASLAHTRLAQYQLDKAANSAAEALAVAEKIAEPKLLAHAYGSLVKLLIVRGDIDSATHYIDRYNHHKAILDDAAAQSDILRQQAYLAVWGGSYAEAESLARQCLAAGVRSGNPLFITGGYQILSIVLIERGNYVEAYQDLRAILDHPALNDAYHHQLPRLLNHMGYLFLELGAAEQGLIWDQRALDASLNDLGVSRYEIRRYCLMNLATDLIHLGRLDEAVDVVARFEALKTAPDYAQFRHQNRYLLLKGELCAAQRQFTRAIEYAQAARSLAEQYRAPKNIAKSYWLEGLALLEMRHVEDALARLRLAQASANALQHGSLRWKIGLSLAQALMAAGEPADGITQAAQTLIAQTYQTLANTPLLESYRPEHWLNALPPHQAIAESPYPAGLTLREVEVLRLVAGGATNQQIADTLVISPRTVSTHITNILNKIGCENRTAAGAFAIRHNLLTT